MPTRKLQASRRPDEAGIRFAVAVMEPRCDRHDAGVGLAAPPRQAIGPTKERTVSRAIPRKAEGGSKDPRLRAYR